MLSIYKLKRDVQLDRLEVERVDTRAQPRL